MEKIIARKTIKNRKKKKSRKKPFKNKKFLKITLNLCQKKSKSKLPSK